MAKRPALTDDSFLQHIFSPKKNPLPVGLRKRPITFVKGRTKGRVSSYNRMSATNQELLKRSGFREAYLKGDASLADAKRELRKTAVSKGIAKPLKGKVAARRPGTNLDLLVASHIVKELRDSGYPVNTDAVYKRVKYMKDGDKEKAEKWKTGQIRAYGGDDANMVEADGERFNPLWYH